MVTKAKQAATLPVASQVHDPRRASKATPEARFRRLARIWKKETLYLSNAAKKAMHPAYQGIIGLGELGVPLILNELRKDPADWFWALAAITGENPVPEDCAGDMEKMAAAWLRWGQDAGYLK